MTADCAQTAVVDDRETPYAWEQRRRVLARQPLLTLEERQACIHRFEEGDRNLSRAADCGLLAFGVPAAYGGYNIPERWGTFMYGLAWEESKIYTQIASHHSVCLMIDILGTPAQYDFFLPQLAAGKRTGVMAAFDDRLIAVETSEGFLVSGTVPVIGTFFSDRLICFAATVGTRIRHFVAPASVLVDSTRPTQEETLAGSHRFVAHSCLLDGVDHPPPDNDIWRAIRWNSAR